MKIARIQLFALLLAFTFSGVHAANHTIQIQNNRFVPNTLTVAQGDTVTWVMRGQNHDTVSQDGFWSSGILSFNEQFPFTFDTPGTYRYFCTPHRNQGMTGTITVQAAANTPPTVSITAPAQGATFPPGQNITFSADATDNGTVSSVEFFANGNSLGTDSTSPFTVAASLNAGSYAITAKATDNAGASTTSAAVNITVSAANTSPTVSLASNKALIKVGESVTLTAIAADSDGTVAQVEFLNGPASAGTDTTSPYELPLTNLPAGVHAFTAVATDNSGAKTTSSPVEIRVAAEPKIDSITRGANGTTVKITGTTGIVHTLESSTDLKSWSSVGTVTPEGGSATITDNSTSQVRFYRVAVK